MVQGPLVSVYKLSESDGKVQKSVDQSTPFPAVFKAPVRDDLVSFIHNQIRCNKRQAHGVKRNAGVQVSALSWGTGRAVSRIPRVRGGGTHRSGQGAYGNMCRGGHTFNPLVTYRRWHRKVNVTQKRHATASALAATVLPSIVMARGHAIENVDEIPLVFDETSPAFSSLEKTKVAVSILKELGAYDDVKKSKESRKVRPGKGKMRNRRYVMKKGPLLIHDQPKDSSFVKAFRNIPGLDLMHVERMNLLKLAPGGHLGRFVVWSLSAFKKLDTLFGNYNETSKVKTGYTLPRSILTMSDTSRIVNSQAVQKVLRPKQKRALKSGKKVNPLKNAHIMHKLNPFARVVRRRAILEHEAARQKAMSKPVSA